MRKVLVVGAISILVAGQAVAQVKSVGVLPFESLSTDPEAAFFAAGLREELLNRLPTVRGLGVSSTTSADAPDVQALVQGSIDYADGRVRIRLRLVDAMTDEILWSETFQRDFTDRFVIQAEIAATVAEAMQVQLVAGRE
jgi:TolB-like protein